MKNVTRALAAAAAILAASSSRAESETAVSDSEVWNEGVEAYRAGDTTNALSVLRPLMLSRSHGPRAAEIVAKLSYDKAHESGCQDPVPDLEEAAAAAQIALRANPEDERARRNFARAVDGLPELRETKRINAAVAAAQGKDPGGMLLSAAKDVRSMMAEAAGIRTNAADVAVAKADSLSARAEKLADVWLPVKEAVCQAVTNEEQAATITMQADQARQRTASAATALADLSEGAYSALAESEQDFTRFMKMTVLPPDAMREDFVAQSNAWQDVERFNGRDWQHDALDFTRAFRAKFPAWAQAYEQQAAADTNKPPFTAEAQAKISDLSTRLEKLQLQCCENLLPPTQEEALGIIREILELLPKDGGGGQSKQNQQQPQKNDSDKNSKPQQNDTEQNQDDGEQKQDEQQGGEEQNDQKDDGKDDSEREGREEQDKEDREVEAVLKKAQERSDEHEAEKKARMRKAPLPPNARDW